MILLIGSSSQEVVIIMKELVGSCKCCGKEIYCLDGFFNGVITENKQTYCFDCHETISKEEKNPQS